jgi:uncharacterized protein YjbJ (UPF0337 family)
MSNFDKMGNEAEEAKGKVKEWVGDATDNESLQAEGVADQAKAHAKQAGEHVKDAGRDVLDAVDGSTGPIRSDHDERDADRY